MSSLSWLVDVYICFWLGEGFGYFLVQLRLFCEIPVYTTTWTGLGQDCGLDGKNICFPMCLYIFLYFSYVVLYASYTLP